MTTTERAEIIIHTPEHMARAALIEGWRGLVRSGGVMKGCYFAGAVCALAMITFADSTLAATPTGEADAKTTIAMHAKNSGVVTFYLAGVLQGMIYTQAFMAKQKGAKPIFCVPAGIDASRAYDIFEKFVLTHPSTRDVATSLVLMFAFIDRFPCTKRPR